MEASHAVEGPVDIFVRQAQVVSADVSPVATVQDAAALIASLTQVPTTSGRYTAGRSLADAHPDLIKALRSLGLEVRIAEEVCPQGTSPTEIAVALAGDVALMLADVGVAETGSILPLGDGLPHRLLGMLADTVFAVLRPEDIVPTLDELGARLSQLAREGYRYLSLVTGPSRTADIERVLTIGVQGPKVLHILILDSTDT